LKDYRLKIELDCKQEKNKSDEYAKRVLSKATFLKDSSIERTQKWYYEYG